MARPKAGLMITEMERQGLESMAHRSRTAPQLARRARIVLACANGWDNTTVAGKLRLSQPTVGRWRQRFRRVPSAVSVAMTKTVLRPRPRHSAFPEVAHSPSRL
jgi:transposase